MQTPAPMRPESIALDATAGTRPLRAEIIDGSSASGGSRSSQVMAAARELSANGVTQRQIAERLGCAQSRISMALTILRNAPELADEIISGTAAFGPAYRTARERRNAHRGLPPRLQRYLTATEAAAILGVDRSEVLRLLGDGALEETHAPSGGQSLTVAQIAGVLGCSPAAVYGLLRNGELAATRSGDRGHYRVAADELRRYLLGGQRRVSADI